MSSSRLPASQHALWAAKLRELSKQPLALCPNFPEIADRWEAWWNFRADRPLVVAFARMSDDIHWGKCLHLLEKPSQWLAAKRSQLDNIRWFGEMIPRIRVDIGPIAPTAFLGAPWTVSEQEQTSWSAPVIDDWRTAPPIKFDPDNKWFRLVISLCELTARDARGRYTVCPPEMGGAIDVLSNMRNPDRLCMDFLDEERESAKAAAMQIADEWAPMYKGVLDAILGNGAGCINYTSPWSNEPTVLVTCDFNALVGPDVFNDCCLPSLARHAHHAGRVCFHLDGPQAARHAPALATQEWMRAMQYSPGAATPSALAKLDMLRAVQDAGKPVLVYTPKNEVAELARKLDRRGLAIMVEDPIPPAEIAEFEAMIGGL